MIELIKNILYFLNQNTGLVTLAVGFFAIILYIKQVRDSKRNAAKLILQEIRYAEQQVRIARTQSSGNYSLSLKLLPTNSWHKNIHLFIKDIKETQLDIISKFYSQSAYLDVVIKIISDYKCHLIEQQIIPSITQPLQQNTSQSVTSPKTEQSELRPQLQYVEGLFANKILKNVSSEMDLVYNTPAVEKLIQISEKKWYQLI